MARKSSKDPLGEFWEFFKQSHQFVKMIGATIVIAPIADLALRIGPPWPNRMGVAFMHAICEIVVAIGAFTFLHEAARRRSERCMAISMAAFAVILIGYVLLYANFIFDTPDWKTREIGGLSYLPDVKEIAAQQNWPPSEVLNSFEHNPNKVWEPFGLNLMRGRILLLVWLLFFSAISLIFTSFVVRERLRKMEK